MAKMQKAMAIYKDKADDSDESESNSNSDFSDD